MVGDAVELAGELENAVHQYARRQSGQQQADAEADGEGQLVAGQIADEEAEQVAKGQGAPSTVVSLFSSLEPSRLFSERISRPS